MLLSGLLRGRWEVMADFIVILSQGRSGSTLLLRMLNAVPGVQIAGENGKALDHLRSLLACFDTATTYHYTEFCRHAWRLPCPLESIKEKTRSFVSDLYDPTGTCRIAGFKEIRYGLGSYDELCHDIAFLRQLMPGLKIIFNTRRTEDAMKSSWWAENPEASRGILDRSRASFERYHSRHGDFTFLIPYEELHHGSEGLRAMFDFLGLEFTRAARSELTRQLR
jgi:hypothetical protein